MNFYLLLCHIELINDTYYQADANEIERDIVSLQQKIREKTKKNLERELNLLKNKIIEDLFHWCFKILKTALIYFKDNKFNIIFNRSDNCVVKNGIIQYF